MDIQKNTKPDKLISVMKQTHARDHIMSFIQTANRPVAADEITAFLQSVACPTNRVTVYRTLETFVKNGLVRRLEFGEGKFRYEIAGDDHHHLICRDCGAIAAVSDTFMAAIEKQIEKEKGFLVDSHALEFYGVCRNCLANNHG